MSAKRFVFSMEDGIPAMVERADGGYVRYDDFAALVTENERLRGITKGAPYEVVQALTAERDSLVAENAQLNSAIVARLMAGVAVRQQLIEIRKRLFAASSVVLGSGRGNDCPGEWRVVDEAASDINVLIERTGP